MDPLSFSFLALVFGTVLLTEAGLQPEPRFNDWIRQAWRLHFLVLAAGPEQGFVDLDAALLAREGEEPDIEELREWWESEDAAAFRISGTESVKQLLGERLREGRAHPMMVLAVQHGENLIARRDLPAGMVLEVRHKSPIGDYFYVWDGYSTKEGMHRLFLVPGWKLVRGDEKEMRTRWLDQVLGRTEK